MFSMMKSFSFPLFLLLVLVTSVFGLEAVWQRTEKE